MTTQALSEGAVTLLSLTKCREDKATGHQYSLVEQMSTGY